MLADLLAWFSGKEPNRRKYPRIRKAYRATFSVDAGATQKPAIGIDISGGGLCVLTQEPAVKEELEIRATIESRAIRVRARAVWQDTVTYQGKSVWRYGMRFSGISADDWDAIVRYTSGKPLEESNRAQEELTTLRLTPDDANRLIPTKLQQRLLETLVQRRRLAPLKDSQTPLVQYFYSGPVRHEGKVMHRLTIQSKVVGAEGDEMFETRFVFDDKGENIAVLK